MRIYRYTTMQKPSSTPELFNRFLTNRSNAAELNSLFTYFSTADEAELRTLILEEMQHGTAEAVQNEDARLEAIHAQLTDQLFGNANSPVVRRLNIGRFARIAAVLIAAVSISLLFYQTHLKKEYAAVAGGPKAALLVNGMAKNLTGQKHAVLYKGDGVTVTTKDDGTIVYSAYDADSLTAAKMNTLETPRGGEYRVALSDGSVVMLNAGSKLSFPTGFRGGERKVELEGEAFFAIAKNPKMPFIVGVHGSNIRVLGTKFNVSSYQEDQGVTTTLLEGSIRFSDEGNHEVVLKPNQQVSSQYGKLSVSDVNAADYQAWTKGDFLFNDMPITVIMQKLCRWYNVEADLQSLPDKNLYLKISRTAAITDVLQNLSIATGREFKLEGNKVVLKN
jgi:transmembrane sensor